MQSQFNCRLAANKLLVFPMVALLLVLFPPAAYPADESGEIMTVVDQFFQALEERNGALLEEILYPSSLNGTDKLAPNLPVFHSHDSIKNVSAPSIPT